MFNSIFDFELIRILLFSLSTSLFLAFTFTLFKEIICKILTLITIFIAGIYTLIELSFKNFMGNFMSISMVFGGGDATRIHTEVSTFISNIKPIFYLCLIPFIILLFILIFKKFNYKKPNFIRIEIELILVALVYLISLSTLLITPNGQIKTNKELYKTPTLVDVSMKEFGVQRFLIRDIYYYLFGSNTTNTIDIDKNNNTEITDYSRLIDDTNWIKKMNNETDSVIKNLHEYYMNQEITPKNDYTGLFKDKNLIMIMVESLDMSAINKDLTPTLYRLAHEGWYFDNYYAPKFSCTTGESEFIALTSIIPSNTVCTPYTYLNNNYSTSIFNLFNDSNYTSTSYHSVSDKYYPRKTLHKNMGSSYFYNADDLDTEIANGWPSDYTLMQQAYNVFGNYDKYFSFVITASMHFSYDVDSTVVSQNWDKVKNLSYATSMKRYLAKAIDFDKGLEYLINSLKESGTLDDTVIVIFPDHHPYNLDFDYIEQMSQVDRTGLNEDLAPLIIYNSKLTPTTYSKVSSTFDLLPTIANLFDLNFDPRLYIGNDYFSDNEGMMLFPSGSWVTDKAYYHASTGKWEAKEGFTVDDQYINKINKIIGNKFTASDNTLKKDYFKYLFKDE